MSETRFSELAAIIPNVSRETFADFEAYEKILRQWQKHINLIADATLPEIWRRHIIDSAQIFPLAQDRVKVNWLDVGSGGGFPGLVLAILLKAEGDGRITLIESNGKKAAFLRNVSISLNLPVRVINQRIERNYEKIFPRPDVITARALADLSQLLFLIFPFFGEQSCALLPKGRGFLEEVERARLDWKFDLIVHPSVTDQEAAILSISNLRSFCSRNYEV